MRNSGLEEAQAGIKIARRNVNNLRYADDTTLMAESKEEDWAPSGDSPVVEGPCLAITQGEHTPVPGPSYSRL